MGKHSHTNLDWYRGTKQAKLARDWLLVEIIEVMKIREKNRSGEMNTRLKNLSS